MDMHQCPWLLGEDAPPEISGKPLRYTVGPACAMAYKVLLGLVLHALFVAPPEQTRFSSASITRDTNIAFKATAEMYHYAAVHAPLSWL